MRSHSNLCCSFKLRTVDGGERSDVVRGVARMCVCLSELMRLAPISSSIQCGLIECYHTAHSFIVVLAVL